MISFEEYLKQNPNQARDLQNFNRNPINQMIERYLNWKNSEDPEDRKKAEAQKQEVLNWMKEEEAGLKELGIDPSTHPDFIKFKTQLGETKGTFKVAATESMDASNVNQLYQKYFGRDARQNELDYWTTRPTSELDTALSEGYQNTSGHAYDGTAITPGNTKSNKDLGITTVSDVTGGTGDISKISYGDLPEAITNDPSFKNLSEEGKQTVAATYYANKTQSDLDKTNWLNAIEQAKTLVEPYYAQQLSIAQDELLRGFNDQNAADKLKMGIIDRNIARINEDLATGTERLSVDQQAEMARQLRTYEQSKTDLLNKASSTGMAFSSGSGDLLARAAVEQKDIQQSSKRGFARQLEDMNTQAQRSLEDQATAKADAERVRLASLTDLARQGEKALGTKSFTEVTKNLNDELKNVLGDVGTLGNITGTMEQQKTQDILDVAKDTVKAGDLNLQSLLK